MHIIKMNIMQFGKKFHIKGKNHLLFLNMSVIMINGDLYLIIVMPYILRQNEVSNFFWRKIK